MTKAELHAQVDAMTDEEAAKAELVYAPDWPSKKTSIDEMRKRMGTYKMSLEEREAFWRERRRGSIWGHSERNWPN